MAAAPLKSLGIWIEQTEGAKFSVEGHERSEDARRPGHLVASCDGSKGFPEPIEHVFPKVMVQTCIVHMLGNLLCFVSFRDRKAVAKDLKRIYTAANPEAVDTR